MVALLWLALMPVDTSAQGGEEPECSPCSPPPAATTEPTPPMTPVKNKKSPGYRSFIQASAEGNRLWNDATLGTTGFTCLSGGCHGDFENLSFDKNQLFPHYIETAHRVATLTQMINYCLVNPMAGQPLPADSDKMTAMAAFYRSYRMQYRKTESPPPSQP